MSIDSAGAERATAAATLLADAAADAVLDRTAPEDFAEPACRAIVQVVADMRDDGVSVDPRAVAERMRLAGTLALIGGEAGLDSLTAFAPKIDAIKDVASRVAELARWRERSTALNEARLAIDTLDRDAWDLAEQRLSGVEDRRRPGSGWNSPHDIGLRLMAAIEDKDRVRYRWPLQTLNALSGGGARRGQLTFIGGPVSHGKSIFVDMSLDSMARSGANAALFVNEMTVDERAERIFARLARVKFGRIQQATAGLGELTADECQAIITAMSEQPVAMIGAADWTARDIAREARRRRLDVLAVDIVQGLPHESGRKRNETLESAVQHLDALAKDTGCHVILTGHVNRARVGADGTWPLPGLGDVRDCAELVNRPDNVLFVWRAQDADTLDPIDDGLLRVAKYRGARLKSFPISLLGEYQTFYENPMATTASAAAA